VQYVLEHFGVAVCAVTGALAGRGKRIDAFGILVLAFVAALGGGTLRDVILQAGPVFWVADHLYVLNVTIVALLTFVAARLWRLPYRLLLVADAFGLAFFTALGTEKAFGMGTSPTIAVLCGLMTGVAGGAVRDVLTGEIPLVFRQSIYLYATASFCGGVAFVGLQPGFGSATARVVAVIITLCMRLAAIYWRIHLPVFETKGETKA
jgi:uncharacterized membrane protein YeiH